jgi:hypothetical protein
MSGPKVDGQWKTPASVHVKVGNTWKIAAQTYSKIDGVWKITTLSSPPPAPILSYQSNNVFRIIGYDNTLVYETSITSGSGTATLNTSTGGYTITGNSDQYRFSVFARYAPGALLSRAGFMERKPYSYSCRQVTYTEDYAYNCRLEGGNCYCVDCSVSGSVKNDQCGCYGPNTCTVGSIGEVVCDTGFREVCCNTVCNVLINEPGFTNSGSAWYRAG